MQNTKGQLQIPPNHTRLIILMQNTSSINTKANFTPKKIRKKKKERKKERKRERKQRQGSDTAIKLHMYNSIEPRLLHQAIRGRS